MPSPLDRIDFHASPEANELALGTVDRELGDCHAFANVRVNGLCVRLHYRNGNLLLITYFNSLAEARKRVTDAWGEPAAASDAVEVVAQPAFEYWYFTVNGTPVEGRLEVAENGPAAVSIRETQTMRERIAAPAPRGLADVVGMTPKQLEVFGDRLYDCTDKMCRVALPVFEGGDMAPMLKLERGKVTHVLQGYSCSTDCVGPETRREIAAAFGEPTDNAVVGRPELTRLTFAQRPGVFVDLSSELRGLARICLGRCDDVKIAPAK